MVFATSRPTFLSLLKECGVAKLSDRQALSNALGRARREGKLPDNPAAGALDQRRMDESLLMRGAGRQATPSIPVREPLASVATGKEGWMGRGWYLNTTAYEYIWSL